MHIYNRRAYQAAIDRNIASRTNALIAQDRANDLSDVYARIMDTANDLADAFAEQGEAILQEARKRPGGRLREPFGRTGTGCVPPRRRHLPREGFALVGPSLRYGTRRVGMGLPPGGHLAGA